MTKKFRRTKDRSREVRQEELILDVTEQVFASMKLKEIAKSELAKRLNKSKAYVSQLLSGSRNMTLRTLADVCWALDVQPSVRIEPSAARQSEARGFVPFEFTACDKDSWPAFVERVRLQERHYVANDLKHPDSLTGDWQKAGRIVRAQKEAA